jgi:Xaa-Pro dipeptidase
MKKDRVTEQGAYPRFSAAEIARRWELVGQELDRMRADVLVAYGADRSDSTVQWLTHWPVTREALLHWEPRSGSPPVLLVQHANHVDNAARLASGCEVCWGGPSTWATLAEMVSRKRRSGPPLRLGTTGPVPASGARLLRAGDVELIDLDPSFQRLRLVKSDEELAWVQRGAELTDAAVSAIAAQAGVGTTETDLVAIAEAAYVPHGGTTVVHYFCTTPMADPSARVPAQWPTCRRLRAGDVLVCEVSASWWGYPGQLLRTFTVGEEPNPLYRSLHDVADAAFEALAEVLRPGATGADLREVARLIEREGYASCDDLVHGFVGGYLPPVVPGAGREAAHDTVELREGMTVVLQPNVVTCGGMAGVQTGELVVVTTDGPRALHEFPRGIGLLAGGPKCRTGRG